MQRVRFRSVAFVFALFASTPLLFAQSFDKDYENLLAGWQKEFKGEKLTTEEAIKKADEALAKGQEAAAFIKLGVAKPDELPKLKKQKEEADTIARQYYKIALAKATDKSNQEKLNEMRYRLCVFHYQQRKYDEARILGEYLSRKSPTYDYAAQAGKAAMYAYFQIFNKVKKEDKAAFTDKMVDFVKFLSSKYKNTPEGREALGRLADIAFAVGDPKKAEEIAGSLEGPEKAQILLKLGLSKYSDYIKAQRAPKDQRPSDEEMQKRLTELKKALEESTKVARSNNLPLGYTIMASELALVQMYNDEGKFDQAAKLLEISDSGLVDQALKRGQALQTPSGESIAGEVFKAALRTYMGQQNLEKSEKMLRELAGKGNQSASPGDLTKMYLSLSKQMLDEVERLRESGVSGETLGKSLAGLSTLLETTAKREQGHSFGTLSWCATSLHDLAEKRDSGAAQIEKDTANLYTKAAGVYQNILDTARENEGFADERNLAGIRVKLSRCQNRLGLYDSALKQLEAVLTDYPKNLEAQKAAAYTYQQWGAQTQNADHYETAVGGWKSKRAKKDDPNLIWGWAKLTTISRRLPQYRDTFYEARYNWVLCRARAALLNKDDDELEKVEGQVLAMHRADPKMGGEEWKEKYEQLLNAVQRRLDKTPSSFAELEAKRRAAAEKNK